MGYALAGVATGTASGYSSTIVYITIYIIMNMGAFACLYLMKAEERYTEEIVDLSDFQRKTDISFIFNIIFLVSWYSSIRWFFC